MKTAHQANQTMLDLNHPVFYYSGMGWQCQAIAFTTVDAIPRTSTGKFLKRALRQRIALEEEAGNSAATELSEPCAS
jgi:hypothetical protein